jgi:hypothetical protein
MNVEELTIEDVKKKKGHKKFKKNNKVAGTDGIHSDLIKYEGNKLLNRIYELVRHMLMIFRFDLNLRRVTGTFHDDLCTFTTDLISRILTVTCFKQNCTQNTHFKLN